MTTEMTVFSVEEINGEWFAVVELHENCLGMNHKTCKVKNRQVAGRYPTLQAGMDAVNDWLKANRHLLGLPILG